MGQLEGNKISTAELAEILSVEKRSVNRYANRYGWSRSYGRDSGGRKITLFCLADVSAQFPQVLDTIEDKIDEGQPVPDLSGANISTPESDKFNIYMKKMLSQRESINRLDSRVAVVTADRMSRVIAGAAIMISLIMTACLIAGAVAYVRWEGIETQRIALQKVRATQLAIALEQGKVMTLVGDEGHTNEVNMDASFDEIFGGIDEEPEDN